MCPVVIAATTLGGPSLAQPQEGGAGQAASTEPAAPSRRPPPPLLREGSRLVGTRGQLEQDPDTGWWQYRIETVDPERPDQVMIMLPTTRLEQIVDVVQASDEPVRLELAGDVYVYRGRNFLLPTQLAEIIEIPADERPPPGSVAGGGADPEPPEPDSVDDIIRELAAAVGPIQRRPESRSRPVTDEEASLVGGTILARRGKLERTHSGGWLFVFDADAEGHADPPLVVMPCLLLEHMERYISTNGRHAPLLLSGPIHRYAGRRFVLPTVFREPRERTQLSP
jgi:hypothetical protein